VPRILRTRRHLTLVHLVPAFIFSIAILALGVNILASAV